MKNYLVMLVFILLAFANIIAWIVSKEIGNFNAAGFMIILAGLERIYIKIDEIRSDHSISK